MLAEILRGQMVLYAMGALCLLGVISKLIVWISYKRLVKASNHIASSNHSLTRQLKLKFENCYKLNLGVQKVPVFVDKYLQKYKAMGIRVHTLNRFFVAVILLEALLGVAGCLGGFWQGLSLQQITLYAALGFISVLFMLFVDSLCDIEDKREMVVTNLQDYLDNVLTNRLQHEYDGGEGQELMAKTEAAKLMERGEAQTAATKLKIKKTKKAKKSSDEEEEVIREILREFLT